MARSKVMPLRVIALADDGKRPLAHRLRRRALVERILSKESSRIRELELSTKALTNLTTQLPLHLDQLKSLRIRGDDRMQRDDDIAALTVFTPTLYGQASPLLESLRIINLRLTWKSGFVHPQLRQLHLIGHARMDVTRTPVTELVSVLRSLPLLQELVLRNVLPDNISSCDFKNLRIPLPRLQYLLIAVSERASSFMHYLDIPLETIISVQIVPSVLPLYPASHTRLKPIPGLEYAYWSLDARRASVTFATSFDEVVACCLGQKPRKHPRLRINGGIRGICPKTLALPNLRGLILAHDGEKDSTKHLISFFRAMNTVQTLILRRRVFFELIHDFGDPYAEQPSILLSQLRRLQFQDHAFQDADHVLKWFSTLLIMRPRLENITFTHCRFPYPLTVSSIRDLTRMGNTKVIEE